MYALTHTKLRVCQHRKFRCGVPYFMLTPDRDLPSGLIYANSGKVSRSFRGPVSFHRGTSPDDFISAPCHGKTIETFALAHTQNPKPVHI